MSWLRTIYAFPEHHVSLAWWIALLVLFFFKSLIRLARLLPIWGKKFQRSELARKIRVLERLHQNTYGLILYLADDVVDIAIEFSWTCLMVMIISFAKGISASFLIFCVALNIGSSVVGRAYRIRGLVRGLRDYDATLERLKNKQTELSLALTP